MSHHLEFEQWVPFPLQRVFAFFSNPENLPRIMPASSCTQLIALTAFLHPNYPPDQARRAPALVRALPRPSVCSRFCRSAAGGWRASQNLNGTATSPTCRKRVHLRAGITSTNLRARGGTEPREQRSVT